MEKTTFQRVAAKQETQEVMDEDVGTEEEIKRSNKSEGKKIGETA